MISVKEIIIVEGVYDKIKLSTYIDGVIFVTGGFSIMTDNQKLMGLVEMTKKNGAIIFTDSDSAGLRIRNFLKQYLPENMIKHAYMPEIKGKEKRKNKPGAEGIVGVEGATEEIILEALRKSGCSINNEPSDKIYNLVTKLDLYDLGLYGKPDSAAKRKVVLEHLGLPLKLSSNMLCKFLSQNISLDVLKKIVYEKTSSQM